MCLCMVFVSLELSGKCHSLWTGFTSLRKCHYCQSSESLMHHVAADLGVYMDDLVGLQLFAQDWWNMKVSAQWRSERPSDENPVYDPPPLMHTLPGGGPCESPPDQMHTWHHGIGREFVACCIVSFHAFSTRVMHAACMYVADQCCPYIFMHPCFFCFMRFFWHAASKSGEVPISKKDYEELLHRSMHGGLPTK